MGTMRPTWKAKERGGRGEVMGRLEDEEVDGFLSEERKEEGKDSSTHNYRAYRLS